MIHSSTSVHQSAFPRLRWLPAVLLFGLVAWGSAQTTVYSTDFEAPTFAPSTTGLVGKDGWIVAASGLTAPLPNTQPVYGVDTEKLIGLGQSAYIGFETPLNPSSLYIAYRPTPVTSLATNPLIRFTATIGLTRSYDVKDAQGNPTGIQYATQNRHDTFRLAFYNNGINNDGVSRRVMASIEWPTFTTTSTASGTIYRGDSSTDFQGKAVTYNTDVDIIYGDALQLNVLINLQTNRWTASLDGSPLFVDAVFRSPSNASTIPLTGFGTVAAQWAITPYYAPTDLAKTNPFYDRPGNNWMLFDDWTIINEPLAQMAVSKFERVNSNARLTWATELGYSYRVEFSTNLSSWSKTLANSLITPTASATNQTYTDPASLSGKRYYRVRRALTGTPGL